MTLLRNIFSDLLEKRLWPLAVVLIAALFVAPGVLSKPATTESSSTDVLAAAPGSAAAKAAAVPAAQVTLDTTVPGTLRDRGPIANNPFKQQYVPKLNGPTGQLVTTTGSGDTSKPATNTGGAGTGTGGSTTTTTTKTPSTSKGGKKHSTSKGVSVSLRFGESGNLGSLPSIAPYTPLPSQNEPFFVFLGVRADKPTVAVFLVSSDAKATGDGACKPDATTCDTIELRAGETEFFDLTTGGGSKQYQLDVVKVTS